LAAKAAAAALALANGSGLQAANRGGPCYNVNALHAAEVAVHFGTAFEVYATGTCHCIDGTCKQVSCSAEAGTAAEAEVLKIQLRAELSAKAATMNGQLDQGSVTFSIRAKFK
jgi:hypothetical protein